ncbi:MAG: glutamyl-tRNA reductase [Gemmatimonadetes bacterium]|nr:glutamyl-tRNA reductase [Gemmatimonadota bacterium]NNF11618.1 glutamyl-tRNA reductase [Gemmatimonadota bacterium]
MNEPEIFVIGTSQSVASAAMREQIYVDLEELYETLGELLTCRGLLDEAIPLATCGRLELYCVAADPNRAVKVLVRMMERRTGLGRRDLRDHVYVLRGDQAVRHLFRVASGLDSVVHGEAQILGQVREAARDDRADATKGPVLHRMFESALATGKKVRTETEIGRGAASLAGAALRMVQRDMPSLESSTALVIGAGDTGSLVARLLAKGGIGRLILANRTLATAEAAGHCLGAEIIGLEGLAEGIARADLIVGAVMADDYVVTAEALTKALVGVGGAADGEPRYFLDLAHPRNFDPAIAGVPGVRLFDLDHVFERVEAAKASRAAQVPRAEAIVVAQAENFRRWLTSRQGVHVLRAVRAHVLDVAKEEAERFSRGRTAEEREQIRRFARSMARTLLHQPTVALRDADPANASGRSILEAAPTLFGVDVDGQDEAKST